MRFNSVIISSFFVSVVLAAPGRERSLFRVADTLQADSSLLVAGVTFTRMDENGTIQSVGGTIHAPDNLGRPPNSSAAAIVGIDMFASCSHTLVLGVVSQVGLHGEASYKVKYEYDHKPVPFPDIDIKAGDEIKLMVDAYLMQGFATIVNLSNYQNVTQQFNLTESFCGKTASWLVLVSDVSVNLGTLTFANAEFGGNDFHLLDRKFVNITQDGNPVTTTSADSDSVTVQWM